MKNFLTFDLENWYDSEFMEFGARALGNRSILAHPYKSGVVREINEAIKQRDFWMPFACSILDVHEKKYLVNPVGF